MPDEIYLPTWQSLYPHLVSFLRVIVILAAAVLAARISGKVIRRLRVNFVEAMMRHAGGTDTELEKRATTIGGMLRKTAAVVFYSVAIVMALRELGFDIRPLLAGAGVAGLAIGFGAQNLVRDIISGLFMLLENQVRINDVVVINGTGGLVEELNLRTTVLRSLDGTVHIFPNGAITSLSNTTREFSYYVFDIGVAYKEDTDHVADAVRDVGRDILRDPQYAPDILEPIEILGVDKFADSAVIIKARIKTLPLRQWVVGREMNRRIKKKFDEAGIEIPFPHTSLYVGEATKALPVTLSAASRDEMKALIREALAELGFHGPATARA